MANALAELVAAVHEIGQELVQATSQHVVDAAVVDLRKEPSGQALGLCRLRIADGIERLDDAVQAGVQ